MCVCVCVCVSVCERERESMCVCVNEYERESMCVSICTQESVLTLLDVSAAFDTIDHNILLHQLEHAFGITGTALSWIRSYLSERDQTVVVNGLKS